MAMLLRIRCLYRTAGMSTAMLDCSLTPKSRRDEVPVGSPRIVFCKMLYPLGEEMTRASQAATRYSPRVTFLP